MARAGAVSSIFPQSVIYSQPVDTSPHIISDSGRFAIIDVIVNLIRPYSKSKCVYVKNQFICHEYIKILIFKSCDLCVFVFYGIIYCRIGMTSLFPVDVTNFVKL